MVFVRSMLNSAKRIPMIRFRKGGPHLDAAGQSAPATQAGQAVSGAQPRSVSTGEAIEEWQLPARYRRKPIDDVEIEWINRGGPPA
ncbi:uncharacterized protein LOC6032392 isoform X1 [Culex quinquefasciatus]|uniref:uncharacterized protein LOC6032392 isoform X1 n=1 Tax=Culex quinquefasciatus TaxID=7176 RepID=UPI0018E3336A|nr:uncharacterized protein LOC6032392 isoform X1 [Culex quinquefasciatus]